MTGAAIGLSHGLSGPRGGSLPAGLRLGIGGGATAGCGLVFTDPLGGGAPRASGITMTDEQWFDSSVTPEVLMSHDLSAGKVLQIATREANQVDGSALFVVTGAHNCDGAGRFIEARFAGL